MALSDEQKKKIEEEEAYRAKLRGTPQKKKGLGCLGVLGVLFIVGIVSAAIFSAIPSSKLPSTTLNPVISEEQKKQAEELHNQQVQEYSTTYCTERSKPNVIAVNLADFIVMLESNGEVVTIHNSKGVYPTKENCQKVMDLCLTRWDAEDCKNIAERKIWIGMEANQLVLSWGIASDENNTTFSSGVHSQWVYGDLGPYAYLEGKDKNNLKVTSWQD